MAEPQDEKFSGQILSEARKKRRLRYKRLSTELNIPEKYLQALEEEDYGVMPGGDPYIRGYLRAYAKKLGIDPDFIIERYSENLINEQITPIIKPPRGKDIFVLSKKYIMAVALFLLFLLFIYLSPSCSEEVLVVTPVEDQLEKVFVETLITETGMELEKIDSLKNVEDFAPSIDLINKKIEVQTAEEPFVMEDVLEFYFLKECWISVENEFEKLVYKLAGEETSLEVRSKGPFKVIVGNAKNANLIFNGIVVDLLESSNRENNVSCVVLPSGKCSEFPRSK
jgi:transcriptional regulator with XRE-family HTH domain